MTCLTPPQSLADFASLIDRCATVYGGSDWRYDALLGVITLAIAGLVLVGMASFATRRRM